MSAKPKVYFANGVWHASLRGKIVTSACSLTILAQYWGDLT